MKRMVTGIAMVLMMAAGVQAQTLWSTLDPVPTSATTVVINNNDVYELDVDGEADILRIANQATGESGTLNIVDDKTLTVARFVQLGTQAGPGFVNQSDGTLTAQQFSINHNGAGSLSEYNLSGGSATATTSVTVNNQGLLAISDGTLTTPVLTVNSGGIANLTGGTLNMNGTLTANGTVTIDGGTIARDIEGVNTTIAGTGKIELLSGSYALTGGEATDVISLSADLIEVSGGSLNWQGQVRGGGGNGVFRVIGDEATISMLRLSARQEVGYDHTFDFIFGEEGISSIDVGGWIHLSGATIHVDGAAYTGGVGTFTLISGNTLSSLADTENITVTGFDSFADAYVTQEGGTVALTVIPEPATISLLVVAGVAALLLRRVRR